MVFRKTLREDFFSFVDAEKYDLAGVFDYSLVQFLVIGITPFLSQG
jgi:hypothetical protein